jgi:hypothetical protein
MQYRLMLLGANALLAYIGILTPAAASEMFPLAEGPADGAGFQEVSNGMPGVVAPGIQHFPLLAYLLEFIAAQHKLLPRL